MGEGFYVGMSWRGVLDDPLVRRFVEFCGGLCERQNSQVFRALLTLSLSKEIVDKPLASLCPKTDKKLSNHKNRR